MSTLRDYRITGRRRRLSRGELALFPQNHRMDAFPLVTLEGYLSASRFNWTIQRGVLIAPMADSLPYFILQPKPVMERELNRKVVTWDDLYMGKDLIVNALKNKGSEFEGYADWISSLNDYSLQRPFEQLPVAVFRVGADLYLLDRGDRNRNHISRSIPSPILSVCSNETAKKISLIR